MASDVATRPNDLDAFWMPFTANKAFKAQPRLLERAEGVHYYDAQGRELIDASAGLWCVNVGHGREKIVEAVSRQIAQLDYAPPFQWAHPRSFELASKLQALFPGDLDHAFFTNSGSESVDTALKIALAYQRAIGQGTRTRFIGRERGYHGVGFGGISVGGMVANRKQFATQLPGVDHLRATYDREHQAFSRGQPEWGAHLADDLERLIGLHDASTIAAVIVEPVAGSTGVLPPPVGYLERLRAICDRHGILLIFDEVITAYGRLGKSSAAEAFGVTPDLITTAKGLTSGTVPMGAVMARGEIYEAITRAGPERGIEFAHGYTYSAHPLAVAAALATLEIYEEESLFERASELAPHFERAVHDLAGEPGVIDVRNIGLMAAIDLEPREGAPGARAYDYMLECYERGMVARVTADTLAFSPPLIVQREQIDRIFEIARAAIRAVA